MTGDNEDENSKASVAMHKLINGDINGAIAVLEEGLKYDDSDAQWMLGLCCEYGVGIDQDTERAELLYRQSFRAGNVVGRFLVYSDEGGRGSGELNTFCL